jgi:hypothetical protein
MPAFYFTLYRNKGTLLFPRSLRQLTFGATVVFAVVMVAELVVQPGYRRAASVLYPRQSPWTAVNAATLLNLLSNLAYILLLVAFFRQSDDNPHPNVPISKALKYAVKVAVWAWTIWLAINIIRVVYAPFGYFRLRQYALSAGQNPPPFSPWMEEVTFQLLSQACLFAGAYIIFIVCEGRLAPPVQVGPED